MAKKKRPRWYVQEWLDHLGVTQEDLAARMGTSKGYLSDVMTGKRRYNESILAAIADALGRSEAELLGINPTDAAPSAARVISFWDHLNPEQQSTIIDLGESMAKRGKAS